MTTALIIGCVVGYVLIGAVVAGAFGAFGAFDVNEDHCVVGVFWPLFLCWVAGFQVSRLIRNRIRRKREFESEALKVVPEEKECG